MGITGLIAAEFIPISLLTDISRDLQLTAGQTGQSVIAVGIFAVITSLLIIPLIQEIDKRCVVLAFSLLLALSNLMVAIASNYILFFLGRCLLGIGVGGFWSLTSAVVLQLAHKEEVSKALSIVYAGVSVATIVALPFANYLGYFLGWRMIFLGMVGWACLTFIWQLISLPTLDSTEQSRFVDMVKLVKEKWVLMGLLAIICSYAGYHSFFTYLKPFLQYNLRLNPHSSTLFLLGYGIINCLGTVFAGFLLKKYFKIVMIITHCAFIVLAFLFVCGLHQSIINSMIVMIWGFLFGIIPVGWSTWITLTLPDRAEMAGGLMVAAVQFSISVAAGLGGFILDHYGMRVIFMLSGVIFVINLVSMLISFSLLQPIKEKSI